MKPRPPCAHEATAKPPRDDVASARVRFAVAQDAEGDRRRAVEVADLAERRAVVLQQFGAARRQVVDLQSVDVERRFEPPRQRSEFIAQPRRDRFAEAFGRVERHVFDDRLAPIVALGEAAAGPGAPASGAEAGGESDDRGRGGDRGDALRQGGAARAGEPASAALSRVRMSATGAVSSSAAKARRVRSAAARRASSRARRAGSAPSRASSAARSASSSSPSR